MDSPSFVTKSITIRGVDGSDITVSEVPSRREVVVSIQQNDLVEEPVTRIRLTRPQFDALCGSKYSLEVNSDLEEAQPNVQL